MNPWGAVIAGLGVFVIILGVKGSYANIETAITGKPHSPASGVGEGNLGPVLPQSGVGSGAPLPNIGNLFPKITPSQHRVAPVI